MAGDEQQATITADSDADRDNGMEHTGTSVPDEKRERTKVIYLTGPVEHANPAVAKARRATLGQYALSEAESGTNLFICPLTHWSQFGEDQPGNGDSPAHRKLAESLMENCSEMIVLLLPGWEDSERLSEEIARAEKAGVKTKTKGLDALKLEPATVQTLVAGMRRAESQVELAPGFYAKERVRHVLSMDTTAGVLEFEMEEDDAPTGVGHMLHLAAQGFYDGTTLHRVIKDHTIQGGCPSGDGKGHAGYECRTEKTKKPYKRGTLALSSADPDHNSSQWFIVLKNELKLNQTYTVIGQLKEGEDVLKAIEETEVLSPHGPNPYQPKDTITVNQMRITANVERFHADETAKEQAETSGNAKTTGNRSARAAKSA